MAEKIGEVYIEAEVRGNADKKVKKLGKELSKTGNKAKGASTKLKGLDRTTTGMSGGLRSLTAGYAALATSIVAIGAVAVRMGMNFINAASAAEETGNKFNVTFQGITDRADEMAQNLQQAYGLSIQESQNLLANTGDLLSGFGFTRDAALDLSGQVQRLSVDLASFQNLQGGSARASEIITRALLGERDSLIALGVKVSEADLLERARAEGIRVVNGRIDQQAKAQLTLRLITEQSANAVGDFSRSQDSFANRTRVLTARIDDLVVAIGRELLPTATEMVGTITEIVEELTDANSELRQFIDFIVEIADVITGPIQAINELGFATVRLGQSIAGLFRAAGVVPEGAPELPGLTEAEGGAPPGAPPRRPPRRPRAPRAARTPDIAAEKVQAGREVLQALDQQAMSEIQIIESRNSQELALLQNLLNQRLISEEQYTAASRQLDDQLFQARVQNLQNGLSIAQGVVGQLGAIFSQMATNRMAEIDNRAERQLETLDTATQAREKFLRSTIKDKKKLDAALAKLEEDRQKKETEITKKTEEEKKKAQIDAFKKAQAINVLSSVINTAVGITKMLGSAPPPANFVLAGLVGTLGAIQTAFIASQKPPALAKGGLFRGTAVIGEAGNELAVPLESVQGRAAIDSFAEGLLGAAMAKKEEGELATIVGEEAGEAGAMNLTIQFADEIWQEKITRGTQNRTILIDKAALI